MAADGLLDDALVAMIASVILVSGACTGGFQFDCAILYARRAFADALPKTNEEEEEEEEEGGGR